MPATRKVGLVAVGVDNASKDLPKLSGAASGAQKMVDWLEGQRPYKVEPVTALLTDAEGRKVSARDVQDAMRTLLDRGDLNVLILYLAGHGIVKSADDEHVLLSDVDRYKDEAIALAPTVLNARYARVPYILIISDACRNAVGTFAPLGTVAGKPALDLKVIPGSTRAKVDQFYATELSQTAKEYNGKGFFTEVLLEALSQAPKSVVQVWQDPGDPPVLVVTADRLEEYLRTEVPLRAASQPESFEQTPDFIVTSHKPMFVAYADSGSSKRSRSGDPADPVRRASEQAYSLRVEAFQGIRDALTTPVFYEQQPIDGSLLAQRAGLGDAFQTYVGSDRGRMRFETSTGYSVIGCRVERAIVSGGAIAEVMPDGVDQSRMDVRLYPSAMNLVDPATAQHGSVAIYLEGGTVCILPILPGYIGTMHVVDNCLKSLAYEVSDQLRHKAFGR